MTPTRHGKQACSLDTRTILKQTVLAIPFNKNEKPYEISVEEAKRITASDEGQFKGRNKLYLKANRTVKVTWAPKQSGIDGPLVMQVVG